MQDHTNPQRIDIARHGAMFTATTSTDAGARYGHGDTHESAIAQLLGDPSARYATGRDADSVEFQLRQQAPGSTASFSVCLDRGALAITH